MVKKIPDVIDGIPNGDIPIFSLGELRLMNTAVPPHMAHGSDDATMVLPRVLADKVFDKSLIEWGVPAGEAAEFKASARATEVMRIAQISHLLRCADVASEEPLNWMATPSRHFAYQTPWSVIQEGGFEQIYPFLYAYVLDPDSSLYLDSTEENDDA